MDCINSMGEVISIEDVDDIGGSCFTYIRVSVHGIPLGTGVGAVAVGDTFKIGRASCRERVSSPV